MTKLQIDEQIKWHLSAKVSLSEGLLRDVFSHSDHALINDRLALESRYRREGESVALPKLILSESITAIIPHLKHPYEHSLDQGKIGRRISQRGETLCRVTGASRGQGMKIFDATGGLCREAHLMSSSGAKVWSSERSLPLYLLSKYALHIARSDVQLTFGEASAALTPSVEPHTVYLDPMFPESKKRAAVGKEAMVLRAFAAQDGDVEEEALLEWALDTASSRVVVKRPLKAPSLLGRQPTSSVRGKAIRFDLYGLRKLPKF